LIAAEALTVRATVNSEWLALLERTDVYYHPERWFTSAQ
jgi:hypothetical protein